MRISEYYRFPDPENLPFVDVNVHQDSALYVDPRAIRLDPTPAGYVQQAKASMTSFFDTVSGAILRGDELSRARALALLQDFAEPWQTRLGLAAHGFRGHGGADQVGEWIWRTLVTNAEAFQRIAILTQLEDIPLFVPGIGSDITSDLTTRIVFGALADFTTQMMDLYPQFTTGSHQIATVTTRVWDPTTCRWHESQVQLPVANGKELLLVPRNWVRPTLLMHARRYYDISVLGYIQDTETVHTDKGVVLKPTKDALKDRPGLGCTRSFILDITLKAGDGGINLTRQFKSFVDTRYEPVPDDILNRKTA